MPEGNRLLRKTRCRWEDDSMWFSEEECSVVWELLEKLSDLAISQDLSPVALVTI
jgi:hypothetical protein